MKKTFTLILIVFVLVVSTALLKAADQPDYNKNGKIKLIADSEFAKNVDWKNLFIDAGKRFGGRCEYIIYVLLIVFSRVTHGFLVDNGFFRHTVAPSRVAPY